MLRAADLTLPVGGPRLLQRIEADLPNLSPQLRKVAAHLVRERGLPHRHRITDLAGLTGTPPVTIVRLAKRYGFKGFCDLKFAFLEEEGGAPGAMEAGLTCLKAPQASAMHLALDDAMRTLGAWRPVVDHPGFLQAARWLHEADGVWVSGRLAADAPVAVCVIRGLEHNGLSVRPEPTMRLDTRAGARSDKDLHLHVALAPTPHSAIDARAATAMPEGRCIVLSRSPHPGITIDGTRLMLGLDVATEGQAMSAALGLLAAWAGALSLIRKDP